MEILKLEEKEPLAKVAPVSSNLPLPSSSANFLLPTFIVKETA